MPLSQLDANAALIVIDLQKGIVALPTVHPVAGIIDNTAQLARAFRERGLPVILVNVTGRAPGRVEASFNFSPPADWAQLIPELDRQPGDYIVTKENISAFYGTALERILRRRGVTQVFLTGVATGSGVEATARQAYDQGFNVVAVTDAMTDLDPDMHRHAVEKVFPKIGERALTAEVLGQLGRA
ncbi:MAG TPA: isochorismatase family cysteine hydrolase [Rhizomicrobium sp.]|jgi:nicotinamidase-related amidase|nr:isochorismatase family cysteine hydrolase [Rhizomicrobium sp.]